MVVRARTIIVGSKNKAETELIKTTIEEIVKEETVKKKEPQ